MEFETHFEDAHIRMAKASKEEGERIRPDPTVVSIDAATEEPFESRVYPLSEFSLFGLAAQGAAADPGLDASDLMQQLMDDEPTMRFVAKRERATGRITYVLVGTLAGTRTLIGRDDLVAPHSYRDAVRQFEDDMLKTWIVDQPSVIALAQWREYDEKLPGDEPQAPSTDL